MYGIVSMVFIIYGIYGMYRIYGIVSMVFIIYGIYGMYCMYGIVSMVFIIYCTQCMQCMQGMICLPTTCGLCGAPNMVLHIYQQLGRVGRPPRILWEYRVLGLDLVGIESHGSDLQGIPTGVEPSDPQGILTLFLQTKHMIAYMMYFPVSQSTVEVGVRIQFLKKIM